MPLTVPRFSRIFNDDIRMYAGFSPSCLVKLFDLNNKNGGDRLSCNFYPCAVPEGFKASLRLNRPLV